ncbi:HNH endonuclease family protein [Sphaerisporangium sp. NPDC051011]|uniref:HNH endonuclease family protein n=1 Tax=Sphaerisporangium sp. NPDC051011 TaxID=3155792 RepID=UPI0033F48DEF
MAGVAASVLLVGCGPIDAGGLGDGGGGAAGGGSGGSGGGDGGSSAGINPLDNPNGTEPGLGAITSSKDRSAAVKLIEKVPTKGRGPKTGYDRDEFGYAWADTAEGIPFARNGCDTRNDVLARDGEDLKYRSGSDCVLISMTLEDPYTGKVIKWSKSAAAEVQIDHVMPLSYDWQMGASQWSKAKRVQIANDPLNLMPVDGPTNSAKGDSGPATWLPPSKTIRCSYAVRFAQVALKYGLSITGPDKDAMLAQCR